MPAYEKQDAFSRFNPGVEFSFFIGAILFSVLFNHPAFIAVSLAGACSYFLCLKGRKGARRLLLYLPVFAAISLANPFFNTYGKTLLFNVFGRPYTLEALYYGMANAGVFCSMLIWYGCYGDVMTSDKFTSMFGSLIPSLSMLLMMILRLVPSFQRKTEQIRGARRCLGLTAEAQSSLSEKLESGTVVLSAMTSWALENSVITSDSMRSRGYGAGKRTSFSVYRFDRRDLAAALFLVACAVLTSVAGIKGFANATYTPDLYVGAIKGAGLAGLISYFAYCFTPTFLNIRESLIWHFLRSRI